ncbi:MAG: Hsp33 family molecular chaperone HslO [Gammaproteobacteria bacterium]
MTGQIQENLKRDKDSLHRFLFENFSVRGKLVRLDSAWQAVLERHPYPPAVRDALGEALAASALLASTLKFEGVLTLQLRGEGPLKLLVAQCTSQMTLRGMATWSGDVEQGALSSMTGDGQLAVSIESESDQQRYQGIVPLEGDTIADCLQGYFENSEQLPTRLWLTVDDRASAGMLLQRLPEERKSSIADEDAWPRVVTLADTLTDDELLKLSNKELLRRLFHEEDVRLFEPLPVSFRCGCSKQRVESLLRTLGQQEVRDIVAAHGAVEVRCEFCNKSYQFDQVDTAGLFAGDEPAPGSKTIH